MLLTHMEHKILIKYYILTMMNDYDGVDWLHRL